MPEKQASQEQPGKPRQIKKTSLPASPPETAERALSQLPDHSSAAGQRQAGLMRAQREGGNQAAVRMVQTSGRQENTATDGLIQRDKAKAESKGGGTGGTER
jgi:hypothetical protein